MSMSEILAELPKLPPEELRVIMTRIRELEPVLDSYSATPSPEEMTLLDREWEDFQKSPQSGSSWEEVEARLLQKPRQ